MKEFPRVEKEFSIDDQEFPMIEQEFPKVEHIRIVTKTREEDCVARKKRRGRPSLGRLEKDKRLAANTRERNRMRSLGRLVIAYIREEFV